MKKTYLITGASSGIGAQFARSLAKRGNDLVLVARRLNLLETLGSELKNEFGTNVTNIACDLSNEAAVYALIEDIKSRNIQIDGLVNNAGFSIAQPFLKSAFKKQREFLEVCVITPTLLIEGFLEGMVTRGYGRIINVSSMVAFSNGAAGHTLYPAAKSYILKMSRSLAAETGDKGVNILALCPGTTESEFQNVNGMADKVKTGLFSHAMSAKSVVESALNANENGKEVLITGFANKLAVWAMILLPEFILTPIIRYGAKKYLME